MDAAGVVSLYEGLKSDKQDAKSWADQLRKFVLPFSPTELQSKFSWMGVDLKNLHDSTAVRANERLAAAHQSFLFDPGKIWFSFEPSSVLGLDSKSSSRVKKWLGDCAERIYSALAESNFYTVNHQALLDRCGLGTGAFFCGMTNENRLMFSYVPFDSFVFSEDDLGMPCLFIRSFEWTADQAAKYFGGVECLSKGMQDAFEDGVERYKKKFTILHAVGKKDRFNPFKEKGCYSLYVEKSEKHVLEDGGFHEFPYMVSRFLKWGSQFGIAPARLCWPEIVNLQYGKRICRVLGELKAFPRVKTSADHVGRVSLRPGGQTVVKGGDSLPQEWGTVGQYAELLNEMEQDRQVVRSAFYLDVLDLFGAHTGEMTATEVNARLDEQLRAFSPTFFQHLNDSRAMMLRVFAVMFRARLLDVANTPKELLLETSDDSKILNPNALPQVVYNSKFVQLMKQVHSGGLVSSVDLVGAMAKFDPSVVHRFDWDFAAQETVRNGGVPETFVLGDDEKQERQEAVMQYMQAMGQAGGKSEDSAQ